MVALRRHTIEVLLASVGAAAAVGQPVAAAVVIAGLVHLRRTTTV